MTDKNKGAISKHTITKEEISGGAFLENKVLNAAKATLDDSLDNLDTEVLARLQHARSEAVAAAAQGQRNKVNTPIWLIPAGGFAVIAVVIGLTLTMWYPQQTDKNLMVSLEDLPLLSSQEDLELYENLEFYQWLANEEADKS